MELLTLSRKRPFYNGYEWEPPLCPKKCSTSVKTLREHSRLKTSWFHRRTPDEGSKFLNDTECFFEQMSSWADTQHSVQKVLEHLTLRHATGDLSLKDSVNERFLEFHRDITEECGAGDKQHSWAVIEKQDEVVMYGPYYPNYNKGEHSEDVIIKQTEEILESESASEGWKVYVFTMNSPCLARNTAPCMLKLCQKAQEWWSVYGVKTHIGYMKCWGFKGTKETLFRDINYSQVDCIDQSEDHECYLKAAEKTDLNPLCEILFSSVKHLLRSVSFTSISLSQGQDWKSYFKNMHGIFESKPEEEKKFCTREATGVIDDAGVLLEGSGSYEEYLERGRAFAVTYSFSSQVSEVNRDQVRLTFQRCWTEMMQEKYAELIREKLTEDFNQCTVQLFIKDAVRFSKEYLQIGRIKFSEVV